MSLCVIISHRTPFYLAHGGCQTMIEAISSELQHLGVNIVMDAWWEGKCRADIIHYFGRPDTLSVRLAKEKGYRVVFTDLLDATASRPPVELFVQKILISAMKKALRGFSQRFGWECYGLVDAYVTIVPHELEVAQYLFGVNPASCYTIPHGLPSTSLTALA